MTSDDVDLPHVDTGEDAPVRINGQTRFTDTTTVRVKGQYHRSRCKPARDATHQLTVDSAMAARYRAAVSFAVASSFMTSQVKSV